MFSVDLVASGVTPRNACRLSKGAERQEPTRRSSASSGGPGFLWASLFSQCQQGRTPYHWCRENGLAPRLHGVQVFSAESQQTRCTHTTAARLFTISTRSAGYVHTEANRTTFEKKLGRFYDATDFPSVRIRFITRMCLVLLNRYTLSVKREHSATELC